MTTPAPVRVLVMEDDPGQGRLVQRSLERAGYQVDVTQDGETGLAQYQQHKHDVLLVDHQMPGKDGMAVLRSLATGLLPPTIVVTGHGDEAIAVEAMKLGAGDYIVKDVDGRYLTLLPTVIERVLHQQRLLNQKQQAERALQETLATLEARVKARTADLQRANARLRAEVSERRRAEEALGRLMRRQKLILDCAGEGIYGVDWQGRTTFVNPAAARMLGWEVEELIGQLIHEVVHGRQHEGKSPSDACPLRASFQDGAVLHVNEDTLWRQNGTSFPAAYTSTPLREEGGEVVGAVVVFQDITERQRAAREMQRADRLALVGQLASGLAHEIGTPLNVIAGNAELLRMQLQDQQVSTAELDAIIEHVERITYLVEQLLTFARAQPRAMTPCDLHIPLSNAIRLLESRFRREGIDLTLDLPADLPPIWGAKEQLEQVFLNLLVNAWHAMPAGGDLTIRAYTTGDTGVRVTFQDTGAGIASADLPRVFEPFYSTKGDKGTGLGLAICRQIVENHCGSIQLDSTPGVGTTVTIDLVHGDM
ncbi:MAG: ATP-binding protein [Candidatus Tectimicrobiota bacterium]